MQRRSLPSAKRTGVHGALLIGALWVAMATDAQAQSASPHLSPSPSAPRPAVRFPPPVRQPFVATMPKPDASRLRVRKPHSLAIRARRVMPSCGLRRSIRAMNALPTTWPALTKSSPTPHVPSRSSAAISRCPPEDAKRRTCATACCGWCPRSHSVAPPTCRWRSGLASRCSTMHASTRRPAPSMMSSAVRRSHRKGTSTADSRERPPDSAPSRCRISNSIA